ncbi:MAG: hypothetical protein ACI901_002062 [Octadecabacter sp.]|jgi:hypothetical protein
MRTVLENALSDTHLTALLNNTSESFAPAINTNSVKNAIRYYPYKKF